MAGMQRTPTGRLSTYVLNPDHTLKLTVHDVPQRTLERDGVTTHHAIDENGEPLYEPNDSSMPMYGQVQGEEPLVTDELTDDDDGEATLGAAASDVVPPPPPPQSPSGPQPPPALLVEGEAVEEANADGAAGHVVAAAPAAANPTLTSAKQKHADEWMDRMEAFLRSHIEKSNRHQEQLEKHLSDALRREKEHKTEAAKASRRADDAERDAVEMRRLNDELLDRTNMAETALAQRLQQEQLQQTDNSQTHGHEQPMLSTDRAPTLSPSGKVLYPSYVSRSSSKQPLVVDLAAPVGAQKPYVWPEEAVTRVWRRLKWLCDHCISLPQTAQALALCTAMEKEMTTLLTSWKQNATVNAEMGWCVGLTGRDAEALARVFEDCLTARRSVLRFRPDQTAAHSGSIDHRSGDSRVDSSGGSGGAGTATTRGGDGDGAPLGQAEYDSRYWRPLSSREGGRGGEHNSQGLVGGAPIGRGGSRGGLGPTGGASRGGTAGGLGPAGGAPVDGGGTVGGLGPAGGAPVDGGGTVGGLGPAGGAPVDGGGTVGGLGPAGGAPANGGRGGGVGRGDARLMYGDPTGGDDRSGLGLAGDARNGGGGYSSLALARGASASKVMKVGGGRGGGRGSSRGVLQGGRGGSMTPHGLAAGQSSRMATGGYTVTQNQTAYDAQNGSGYAYQQATAGQYGNGYGSNIEQGLVPDDCFAQDPAPFPGYHQDGNGNWYLVRPIDHPPCDNTNYDNFNNDHFDEGQEWMSQWHQHDTCFKRETSTQPINAPFNANDVGPDGVYRRIGPHVRLRKRTADGKSSSDVTLVSPFSGDSGSDEDVNEWLEDIAFDMTSMGVSPCDFASQAIRLLEDTARFRIKALLRGADGARLRTDWDFFCDTMRRLFHNPAATVMRKSRLSRMYQEVGQPIGSFAAKLERLGLLTYPTPQYSPKIQDKLIRDHLFESMLPYLVDRLVRTMEHDTSLRELVQQADTIERNMHSSGLPHLRDEMRQPHSRAQGVLESGMTMADSDRVRFNEATMEHDDANSEPDGEGADAEVLHIQPGRGLPFCRTAARAPQGGSLGELKERVIARPLRPPGCFYCGDFDHYVRDCPQSDRRPSFKRQQQQRMQAVRTNQVDANSLSHQDLIDEICDLRELVIKVQKEKSLTTAMAAKHRHRTAAASPAAHQPVAAADAASAQSGVFSIHGWSNTTPLTDAAMVSLQPKVKTLSACINHTALCKPDIDTDQTGFPTEHQPLFRMARRSPTMSCRAKNST